jgi:hypothetical protein
MSARIDLAQQRFGRWTALAFRAPKHWLCRCDCGTEKHVDGSSLRRGLTQGCIKCHPALGQNRTHGQKHSRLYSVWSGMKARCNNPNEDAYPRYGGRGVSVCREWSDSFEVFRDWAQSNGYDKHLTIERRDNDGNYEPSNCRWATYAEQSRNTSRNRPVDWGGRQVLVCDLAIEVGLPQDILKNRIFRYGWTVDDAVSTPVLPKGARRPTSFEVTKGNIDG